MCQLFQECLDVLGNKDTESESMNVEYVDSSKNISDGYCLYESEGETYLVVKPEDSSAVVDIYSLDNDKSMTAASYVGKGIFVEEDGERSLVQLPEKMEESGNE